jgi:hypothetical protein
MRSTNLVVSSIEDGKDKLDQFRQANCADKKVDRLIGFPNINLKKII